MRKLRWILIPGVLAALTGAVLSVRKWQEREAGPIPTLKVERGRLEVRLHTGGELRPSRKAMLVAPSVPGTLRIVHLLEAGSRVQAGDPVVEFDPTEQEYNLEQSQFALREAEQEIVKLHAETAVRSAQDQVSLLQARFQLRRAELDVQRNELLSSIDAQKNLLNLDEARRRLEQLQQDVVSRSASSEATLAVLQEKLKKAQIGIQQARAAMESMRLVSPLSGLVAIKENQDAAGGFFFSGMVLPEYRQGDMVGPGRFIAEVLEVSQMEVNAKVDEQDRAGVSQGQSVELRIDAFPGRVYNGAVKTVAGMASQNFFSGSLRRFDITFQFTQQDETLRPGLTAQVTIVGEQVSDSLLVPRQAIFERDGKPVVFVRTRSAFEPREIKIAQRTASMAAVEGLNEGDEIALVDPEAKKTQAPATGSTLPGLAGGKL